LQLVNDLKQLQNKYEQRKIDIVHHQENNNLLNVSILINTIREYPMVHEQVAAAWKNMNMIKEQCHTSCTLEHCFTVLITSMRD